MDVYSILIVFAIIGFTIILWLNILATIAVKCDYTVNNTQRVMQMFFVWLVPFLGASVVLRLVYQYSPNTIPRSWIPWPFKKIIYGKPIKANKNREEKERIR